MRGTREDPLLNATPRSRDAAAPARSSARAVVLDLLVGLAAIGLVVGTSVRAAFVGSDLRAVFSVSAVGFFAAGVLRGRSGISSVWLKGVVVSSPGLLGTAALILNDGLHRLQVPVAITIVSILAAVAGVRVRRWWATARRASLLLAGSVALALVVGVPTGVPWLARSASLRRVDRPEVSFELTTLDGSRLRSQDLVGQVVVMAVWASWCLPCRWELPEVQAVYDRLRGDARVRFLAVEVGWEGDVPERGRLLVKQLGLTLPEAFDPGAAAEKLRVDSLPTVVVLDARGHVRMIHRGYDRSERVGEQITRTVCELIPDAVARDAVPR